MKNLTLHLFILLFAGILACSPPVVESGEQEASIPQPMEQVYDAALAERLGADDYGMRQYVMAFLKKGPNRDQDSLEAQRLQRAHLDNINSLADVGKLILAGPFLDDGDIRGIYIFDVKSVEEAEKLTATDPAIQAGRLIMELRPWYGSAAMMQVNEIHKRITKEKI
jgi:uncharacterized protein YciI